MGQPESVAWVRNTSAPTGDDPISKIIRFYADSRARNISELVWVGDGMFRLSTPNDITDEQLEEVELEEAPIDGDDDGHVYAYSFPVWIKAGEPFPIKVGKANSDAEKRVADQVKGSAFPEHPVILKVWPMKRALRTEIAIHAVLKARGLHRKDAPSKEWFNTTVAEIDLVIAFINS